MKFGEFVREAREKLKEGDKKFSVRQVAMRVGIEPAYLSKIERGGLRAKPGQRITSAGLIRSRLERELGRPSPTDLRQELAGWLWEHPIFECRDNETVVRTFEPIRNSPTRSW